MVSAVVASRQPMRRFLTLADMSKSQLQSLLLSAREFKRSTPLQIDKRVPETPTDKWLDKKAIGLLFSKRSTRTRIAAEVAVRRLGGYPIFLGQDDIQLGVNESLRDTASVLQALVQGIFARVGSHSELETLAAHTNIPVINALSDLWHPTQVLADLLTIAELGPRFGRAPETVRLAGFKIRPLTVAYIGDSTNVLHDMLVSYPRLGFKLRVATPSDTRYRTPESVLARVRELKCNTGIHFTHDPKEAVHGADVVVTDTWISMGQEAEKADRLKAFKGFQVTEALCKEGGANPNWVFMHCLPRKPDEVSDEVFYGPRSVVFHEAHNRLPTIQAVFAAMYEPQGVAKPKSNTVHSQ